MEKSFRHAAQGSGHDIIVTGDAAALEDASAIVLPGVGAFADCMQGLLQLGGMKEAMEEKILQQHVPFLGICVGMQMLFERSYEHGRHEGLGWLAGEVVPIKPPDSSYKIPHMGWNDLQVTQPEHPLMYGIETGQHAYFVHSYHACCGAQEDVLARVEYGVTLTASVARGNIMGTQFHPEKSQETGLCLIRNFLMMSAKSR